MVTLHKPYDPRLTALNSCFCSIKRLGVLLNLLDGMLVQSRAILSICFKISVTVCRYPHIHLDGEMHCVCVRERECLVNEHDTMTLAKARTQTVQAAGH